MSLSFNVEDNEKLRATVAYNEVYITEIEEEKKQVEEEKRQVEDENKQAKKEKEQAEEEKRQLEEQYLIDKQITKGRGLSYVCIEERIFFRT